MILILFIDSQCSGGLSTEIIDYSLLSQPLVAAVRRHSLKRALVVERQEMTVVRDREIDHSITSNKTFAMGP